VQPQFGAKAPIRHYEFLQRWHDVGVLQENYYSCVVFFEESASNDGQAMVGKEATKRWCSFS
jgi:hypothetical protein